jgi:chromosome partitioning protein
VKSIAFVNQKGGVGKTTCVINTGAGLAKQGKKVLMIDLDPQANLTYSLGLEAGEGRTIYDLMKGTVNAEDTMIEREGFKVIPSGMALALAEMEFAGIPGREKLLQEKLLELNSIDYLIIDCPPSLGILTLNALTTAIEVFIPLQTEALALQGVEQLTDTIYTVRRRLNPHLEITGVIANRYDGRKILNREVVGKIRKDFGNKVFKTVIRENVSLAEAPSWGQTIFEYKPNSYGAEDYTSLCKEITGRR